MSQRALDGGVNQLRERVARMISRIDGAESYDRLDNNERAVYLDHADAVLLEVIRTRDFLGEITDWALFYGEMVAAP